MPISEYNKRDLIERSIALRRAAMDIYTIAKSYGISDGATDTPIWQDVQSIIDNILSLRIRLGKCKVDDSTLSIDEPAAEGFVINGLINECLYVCERSSLDYHSAWLWVETKSLATIYHSKDEAQHAMRRLRIGEAQIIALK